ncbi:MAG: sigma-70 family RNA polymerase sigma factor [Armatimonadota bacterium]|nr:sigma-70 family RNA polymerase sigma factor [bacterium]
MEAYAPSTIRIALTGQVGMDGYTDQQIVERVLAGEMDAFSVLVDRYQDRIFSAVFNYVYNHDDAIDITQEAFVKAYSRLKSFNASSAFYTWLYRIAVNSAIDFLRKRKSRPADSLDDDKFSEIGFEPVSHDASTDPEKVVVRSEQVQTLRKAIASLSSKLKSALILHDVEGLSQEEVAEILNVPLGTVKSRVSRARVELRNLLRKQIGESL